MGDWRAKEVEQRKHQVKYTDECMGAHRSPLGVPPRTCMHMHSVYIYGCTSSRCASRTHYISLCVPLMHGTRVCAISPAQLREALDYIPNAEIAEIERLEAAIDERKELLAAKNEL